MDASFIRTCLLTISSLLIIGEAQQSYSQDNFDPLQSIEKYYADIHPLSDEDKKKIALEILLNRLSTNKPNEELGADYLLAQGLLTAAYAETRGMKGLGDLKRAREYLIAASEADPSVLEGYAPAFLARLYCTLPGWPISWGSSKRCKLQLEDTLEKYQSGFAINFYFGLYKVEEGKVTEARSLLNTAANANFPKEKYPHWYSTLHQQIEDVLVTNQKR